VSFTQRDNAPLAIAFVLIAFALGFWSALLVRRYPGADACVAKHDVWYCPTPGHCRCFAKGQAFPQ